MFSNIKFEELLKQLKSSKQGLSETEAKKRLAKYGRNTIKHEHKISPLKIFVNQFKSFVIAILVAATIISIALGEIVDASIIGIILVVNAVLGFVWEYKAEKSIEALKKLASLEAVVVRDGKQKKIDASLLVPGDIIVLDTGEKIPADARLFDIINLQTQEAALTGESLPIKKELKLIATKTLGDMKNLVFAGTIITAGHGLGIVTNTGMHTEIGKIASLIQESPAELTPLQKKLDYFGKYLGIATIIISIIVFLAGISFGKPMSDMFLVSVALAVAAIPEGLPIVVTIALALGTQRMVKRNALIRKLPSVETLGSTTVICTDKTGTLTHNQMTVKKIYVNDEIVDVSGSGYEIKGMFTINKKKVNTSKFETLLKLGGLCNNAKIGKKVIGDPTEAALIVSAAKAKVNLNFKRLDEIEFDSSRKMMSTLNQIGNKKMQYTKGAPDIIINKCDYILIDGKVKKITKKDIENIKKVNSDFAKQALRVLGFAYKETNKINEKSMVFVGLQAMIDPARKEAKAAIAKCKTAGIKVIMITGDFKETAVAIGRELGLEGKAIDGNELNKIKDLDKVVEDIVIYARVNPEHKIKIVEALRKKGHIVAMTGDGVNDAPALKKADIGISMGITGTDVAKEASEMILTDDNFASIVNAIEEGRGVFDNLKKFVQYLLSSNLGEILVLFVAIMMSPFFNNVIPITAVQILWINLLTDGLPATALAVDPLEKGIMKRQPKKENILNKNSLSAIITTGIIIAIGTLSLFKIYLPDVAKATTVAFTTLVVFQIVRLQVVRMDYKVGIFSNKYLILAVISSIMLQMIVLYVPIFNQWFGTVPLSLFDWFYIILVSLSVLVLGLGAKVIRGILHES